MYSYLFVNLSTCNDLSIPLVLFTNHVVSTYCITFICRVARKILSVYPEALMIKDKSENLPVHLAQKNGREDIVRALLHSIAEDKSRGEMIQKLELQRWH